MTGSHEENSLIGGSALIDFLYNMSSDKMDIETRMLFVRYQQIISRISDQMFDNFDVIEELCKIADEMADNNVYAAMECLDAVHVIGLCSLPSLSIYTSFNKVNGQPTEFYWHIYNEYFDSLSKVAVKAKKQHPNTFSVVLKKINYELSAKLNHYRFVGPMYMVMILARVLILIDSSDNSEPAQKFHELYAQVELLKDISQSSFVAAG